MSEQKIRILGVAPYEGMKTMMQRLAGKRNDIDLTVYVGDLNEGAEIAKRNFHGNFDMIISRGGTAEMISKITSIPLIEINLSVYDILRAIKLAENYSDRYAIVGYSSITSTAQLLCDVLQYDIDIYTIHNVDEVESTLKQLKAMGYQMVLCDMITKTTAKHIGLNAILITSGDESIISAFEQAEKLYRSYISIKEDKRFMESIIYGGERSVVVYDIEGNLVFTSETLEQTDQLLAFFKNEISNVITDDTKRYIKQYQNHIYKIQTKHIINRNHDFAVFYYIKTIAPASQAHAGIKFSNKSEAEDSFFNSFYSVTKTTNDLKSNLDQLSTSLSPLIIIGETGTGKSQIARLIYTQSQFAKNPFITIDCTLTNDKTWQFLINHHLSPINDNDNTLFFKDVHVLSENKLKQLISLIIDSNCVRRNRLIFSHVVESLSIYPESALELINQLSCLTIIMRPLRESTEEIPKLSSLYISTLNLNLAKQIIGFDSDAMALLQNYSWPYNYTQFKRVLEEMALMTDTPYISSATANSILGKEKTTHLVKTANVDSHNTLNYEIDTNLTLNDINREIIQIYLNQCDGNHSQAAKKLGISRTTLWRYLK